MCSRHLTSAPTQASHARRRRNRRRQPGHFYRLRQGERWIAAAVQVAGAAAVDAAVVADAAAAELAVCGGCAGCGGCGGLLPFLGCLPHLLSQSVSARIDKRKSFMAGFDKVDPAILCRPGRDRRVLAIGQCCRCPLVTRSGDARKADAGMQHGQRKNPCKSSSRATPAKTLCSSHRISPSTCCRPTSSASIPRTGNSSCMASSIVRLPQPIGKSGKSLPRPRRELATELSVRQNRGGAQAA